MNGGLNLINGLNEKPFDWLRANGLNQRFPRIISAALFLR